MFKWLQSRKENTRGFSFVELLVAVAIVGLMSTVAFASVNNVRAKTRDVQRANDIKIITTALKIYKNDYGHYPCTTWDTESTEPDFLSELVDGGYLDSVPRDPVNDDGYIYYYTSASNVAGGACGQDYIMSYDIEYPGTECALGGQFITETHCHVSYPDGLACNDPWLYDESYDASDCGDIIDS